jgi:signal transduction histidine kinase
MDVDLTERKRAEQSLREAKERELRAREEYTRDLLNATELERQHLAAELHDSLGQHLSLIKNMAYMALSQPKPSRRCCRAVEGRVAICHPKPLRKCATWSAICARCKSSNLA